MRAVYNTPLGRYRCLVFDNLIGICEIHESPKLKRSDTPLYVYFPPIVSPLWALIKDYGCKDNDYL